MDDAKSLAQLHDCLLLDLDGTVFRGSRPTEGAVDALARTTARTLFVTNNASRSADEVASHLTGLGFRAESDDVVTSAQVAAHLLADRLPPGSRVLVVGTDSLATEIALAGLRPVRRCAEGPAAVVQGHSPDTGWADLAEAALAIRGGAWWVATNGDRTLPTERGLLPGNGALVAALCAATDRTPQIAGKPTGGPVERALQRGTFSAPLTVGDRLDTDIVGANSAGVASLLVLTGVSTAADAIAAPPPQRPTYLAPDLRSLHSPATTSAIAEHPAWLVRRDGDHLTVTSTGVDAGADQLAVVRASARAAWDTGIPALRAGDAAANTALRRWSLLPV